MKKKLQKRAISLLLALFMVLSSFAPRITYAVDTGSNDNNAGGEKVAATYNMHGWGAMVTLVTVKKMITRQRIMSWMNWRGFGMTFDKRYSNG